MNENRNNTLLLTVIGVATLLVAVIGASFAYFTANLYGQENSTTVTVGAGTLSIAYADGNGYLELTAEKIAPELTLASITKTFTVTGNNTTTAIMPYGIELVVQENTFTNNALTYILTSTNTDGNGMVVPPIDEVGLATGAAVVPLGNGYFSGVVSNKVHTYVLNIYFRETGVNQDDDKNKAFGGYVNTTVQSIYTTTS